MSKGVIYIMSTAVSGLIKIGKTTTPNFEKRMYNLEHNGYVNVTALKREFAIGVEDYDDKEVLLHTIFEKSRLSDTELFALDINIAIQLLSSFDGEVIYPKTETKEEIFDDAADKIGSQRIPDGKYTFEHFKKSDNSTVSATAVIQNGAWTILKGSVLGVKEDAGVPKAAKEMRKSLTVDTNGILKKDAHLGKCTPSFAGSIVMNKSDNGWTDWCNSEGQPIKIYRNKTNDTSS